MRDVAVYLYRGFEYKIQHVTKIGKYPDESRIDGLLKIDNEWVCVSPMSLGEDVVFEDFDRYIDILNEKQKIKFQSERVLEKLNCNTQPLQ